MRMLATEGSTLPVGGMVNNNLLESASPGLGDRNDPVHLTQARRPRPSRDGSPFDAPCPIFP
jgi:hypothetical protein